MWESTAWCWSSPSAISFAGGQRAASERAGGDHYSDGLPRHPVAHRPEPENNRQEAWGVCGASLQVSPPSPHLPRPRPPPTHTPSPLHIPALRPRCWQGVARAFGIEKKFPRQWQRRARGPLALAPGPPCRLRVPGLPERGSAGGIPAISSAPRGMWPARLPPRAAPSPADCQLPGASQCCSGSRPASHPLVPGHQTGLSSSLRPVPLVPEPVPGPRGKAGWPRRPREG